MALDFAPLEALFDRIDKLLNEDGVASKDELALVFGEHAEEFLKFCDADGDTKLTKEEFIAGIKGDTEGMTDEDFKTNWVDRMEDSVKVAEDKAAAAAPADEAAPEAASEFPRINGVWVATGFCPVSYTSGHPHPGVEEFASEVDGARYLFSSQQAKDMFDVEPAKYLPQYGGWCATGIAHGNFTQVDPEHFKFVEEKLYLFMKDPMDTKAIFEQDEPGTIAKGKENWETGNVKMSE